MVLECELIHHYELGLHTYFVGMILDVKIEKSMLTEGVGDIEKIRPIILSPSAYYGIGDYVGKPFEIGKALMA